MPDLCTQTFADLAVRLGFSCADAGGLIAVRNPFALQNWTLPVLEVTVIAGAVLTLAYAVIRWRRYNDPTNLAVWLGAIAYLLIIEPPLYFPTTFGIGDHVDTMFAHNVFTVDFLWGRLPLYIVAIYPMMATVAYEIVRLLGVFRRSGVLIGAICVGFVHHAFYEIFDQLGPQLRWWEWAVQNPMNKPFFTSVPVPSIVVFAALWPTSLALCVQLFVARPADSGAVFSTPRLIWRIILLGILASVGTAVLPLPATIGGGLSGSTTVAGIIYAVELGMLLAVAAVTMIARWRELRHSAQSIPVEHPSPVILWYAAAYLAVMAVLWLTALPEYLDSRAGITAGGAPVGSLWYAACCFVIAALGLAAAASITKSVTPSMPVAAIDKSPCAEGN